MYVRLAKDFLLEDGYRKSYLRSGFQKNDGERKSSQILYWGTFETGYQSRGSKIKRVNYKDALATFFVMTLLLQSIGLAA